jgi:hypothetical protein
MSFSFSKIGTAKQLAEAIDRQSEQLTGDSKSEFDEAAPHLKGLLALNCGEHNENSAMHLEASGHAAFSVEGETKTKRYGNVSAHLRGLGATLCGIMLLVCMASVADAGWLFNRRPSCANGHCQPPSVTAVPAIPDPPKATACSPTACAPAACSPAACAPAACGHEAKRGPLRRFGSRMRAWWHED